MKEVKRWFSLFLAFAMLMTALSVNTMPAMAEVSWTDLWSGDGWTLGEENGEPIYSAPNELYRLSYTGSLDGMNTVEGDIRIDSIGVDFGNLSLGLGMADGKKRFFSYTHGTKTMRVFDQNDALQASVEMENALPVGEYTHWKMQWDGVKMTLFINDEKVMDYNYAAAGLHFEVGATCWISEWFHAATVKNLSVKHVELPVSWTDLWSGDGWTLGEENSEPIYSAPNELYRLSYTGSLDGMNTVEGDIRIDSIGVDFGNISMGIKAADGKGRYFSYTHGTGTMRLFDENDVLVTALVMPEALPVGEYTHWKMQWDGTRMVLYVNGKTALVYDYAADGLHFEAGATCLISEWFHAATVKNLQVSNSTVEEPVDPVERWDMSVWQWDDTWVKGVDSATSTEILKTDSELTRIRYTGDFVDKNSIGGDVRIDRRFWDGPGNVGISVTSDQNTEYFAWYNQYNNTITLYRNEVSVGSKQLPDPISLGEWFHLEVSWNDRYLGVFVNNVQRISYECAKDGDTFGADATALLSEWGQPVSIKNMKVEKSEKQIYKNFALSSVFGNGMLFQRRKPVKVFGQGGEIGDTVRVEFAGQTKTATVTDAGGWFVYLDKMEANAVGQTMTVSYTRAGTVNVAEILRVENIVVGELWLASGQSNMMYEIGWLRETDKDRNYLKPYDEIPNLDKLRYFYVTPTYADEPTNYSATTGWVTPVSGNIEGFSATSLGFAAQLQLSLGEDVPVGIIQCALNGSFIEEWLDASTLEKTGSTHKGIQSRLYNGMVYGIKGMSIAGILWYQGEANAFANGMYTTQMEAYIRLYRTLFEDEKLPVVLFQLPQYNEQAIEKAWPIFRQTQWELMKNENVYAVTGIDLGDPFNIHPSDKWPFSGRAAGVALKYIYGVKDSELHPNQKAYGLSPYISSADWTEEGILLSFDDATILTAAGNYIGGFEGFNGTGWIPLDAVIRGNQILLTGNHREITELRYLQRSFFSGNIFVYNEYGLPLAPFASVRRTAPADTKPGQKKVIDFGSKDDLKLFRTYIADGSKAAVEEGMLCTKAGTETKIILKNYISAANMDICVDILPGTANGSMNGGLYLLASAAGSAQDQITAWNVQAERGAGNRNLVVGLHRFDSVNGWQRAYVSVCLYDYFAESEIKEPVRLRVVVKDGKLAAYVDGKLLWENLDVGDLSCGGIGIRSQDASMKFDNFTYTTDASAAIPGDVNGDGVVNSADARLVLQCVVKLSMLTDDKFKIADINGDGRVDSADAREILQISVGLT